MILHVLLKRIFFFFFRKRIVQVYVLTTYVFTSQVKEKLDPAGDAWPTRMTVLSSSENTLRDTIRLRRKRVIII